MYAQRRDLMRQLEAEFDGKAITYVTGDGSGVEAQVADDALPALTEHLDKIGPTKRILLILYTRGGSTLSGWSIVNLIRQFADEFCVIAPAVARSSGTLICLGANNIVMTKQATLGPIDPSVNSPLNPPHPANPLQRLPVSVESVASYIDLAKDLIGLHDESSLSLVLDKLSQHVHPLALGDVYRARIQIKDLARKLLEKHFQGGQQARDRIISMLCTESGSHDYAIYRREAQEVLELPIIKPIQAQYEIIKKLHDDFVEEMGLREPFNHQTALKGQPNVHLSFVRVLVESIDGGSDRLVTDIDVVAPPVSAQGPQHPNIAQPAPPMVRIADEGWKHEAPGQPV